MLKLTSRNWALVGVLTLCACQPTPASTRNPASLQSPDGNAVSGAKHFNQLCSQCHELTPGQNRRAPQLQGIYGSRVAELSDYDYSSQLKASQKVWDNRALHDYISDPTSIYPDTKMLVDNLPNETQTQDIIAFLAEQQ